MKKMAFALALCVLCAACMGAAALHADDESMQQTYTEDGVALAELRAELPELGGMDEAMAERIREEIQTYILAEGAYGEACEYALEDYREDPEKFATTERYGLDARAQVTLQTDTLLAVRYDFTLYTGGPHPWDTIAAQHFDLHTGEPVPLENLVRDPEAFQERVAGIIKSGLDTEAYSDFDGGYEDPAEWPLSQGLLTDEGLLVFYQEGDLGATYAGSFEMLIPYDLLSGQFKDGLGIADAGADDTGVKTPVAKALPIGVSKAFEEERWAGYEVVSAGFYEEVSQPGTVVAALRKEDQNVLCVLRWSNDRQGYVVRLENDQALYPGQHTPAIFYDGEGEEPLITIEYAADPVGGIPERRGFSFYDDGEQYTFLWAYRDAPTPDYEAEDRGVRRYQILEEDGELTLSLVWCDARGYWEGVPEFLSVAEGDAAQYALTSFDIAACDAMFDTALAEAAETLESLEEEGYEEYGEYEE